MTILRLRTEVVDERGRLGGLASAIAACRGNILGVDVHFLDGVRVADEFIIEFPGGLSGDALTTALRRAGGLTVEVERLDQHALVDPVARAIDIAAELFGPESAEGRLERCVGQLVRAHRVRVVHQALAPESGLLRDAWQAETPTVCRTSVLSPSRGTTDMAWVLVIPCGGGSRRRGMIVERSTPAFSSSEVARVSALVRLARAAGDDAGWPAGAPRDGARPPGPLRRRPASFFLPRSTRSSTSATAPV
jgi:hypothetical protein